MNRVEHHRAAMTVQNVHDCEEMRTHGFHASTFASAKEEIQWLSSEHDRLLLKSGRAMEALSHLYEEAKWFRLDLRCKCKELGHTCDLCSLKKALEHAERVLS